MLILAIKTCRLFIHLILELRPTSAFDCERCIFAIAECLEMPQWPFGMGMVVQCRMTLRWMRSPVGVISKAV